MTSLTRRKTPLVNLPLISFRLRKLSQFFLSAPASPALNAYSHLIKSHPGAFSGRQLNTNIYSASKIAPFPSQQIVPGRVQHIQDSDLRHLLCLCFGLLERNMTLMEIQNAQTLLRMDHFLFERKILLLDIISSGKLPDDTHIPNQIKQEFFQRAQVSVQRRKEVIRCFAKNEPGIACLWPDLELVTIYEDDIEDAGNLERIIPNDCAIYSLKH